jgi:hypothetical protein
MHDVHIGDKGRLYFIFMKPTFKITALRFLPFLLKPFCAGKFKNAFAAREKTWFRIGRKKGDTDHDDSIL